MTVMNYYGCLRVTCIFAVVSRNDIFLCPHCHQYIQITLHTLYPGCNIFVYITDQKQPNTSRAGMDCGKLTLFLLLQTLKRRVASQDFAEKHSVRTFMFRHKQVFKKNPFASEIICFS